MDIMNLEHSNINNNKLYFIYYRSLFHIANDVRCMVVIDKQQNNKTDYEERDIVDINYRSLQ